MFSKDVYSKQAQAALNDIDRGITFLLKCSARRFRRISN